MLSVSVAVLHARIVPPIRRTCILSPATANAGRDVPPRRGACSHLSSRTIALYWLLYCLLINEVGNDAYRLRIPTPYRAHHSRWHRGGLYAGGVAGKGPHALAHRVHSTSLCSVRGGLLSGHVGAGTQLGPAALGAYALSRARPPQSAVARHPSAVCLAGALHQPSCSSSRGSLLLSRGFARLCFCGLLSSCVEPLSGCHTERCAGRARSLAHHLCECILGGRCSRCSS